MVQGGLKVSVFWISQRRSSSDHDLHTGPTFTESEGKGSSDINPDHGVSPRTQDSGSILSSVNLRDPSPLLSRYTKNSPRPLATPLRTKRKRPPHSQFGRVSGPSRPEGTKEGRRAM